MKESHLSSSVVEDIELQPAIASITTVQAAESETMPSGVPPNPTGEEVVPPITKLGLTTLLAQHASSSWNARTCEFAFYLFLIELFPDTLLPASIYGFFTTGSVIVLSGWTGGLVDKYPRLRIVRLFTLVQKTSIVLAGVVYLILFLIIKPMTYRDAPAKAWAAFASIVITGCALSLANVGTSVAIERDWVTQICYNHPDDTLTRLNAYMRRIDLLCKLLAPLFTSLLTTVVSYLFAVAFLMGFAGLSLLFELWWLSVVYHRFPTLASNPTSENHLRDQVPATQVETTRKPTWKHRLLSIYHDWKELSQMPVFPSVIAISLLYLTVLSFDGTMLSYLKTRNYNDAFIAGQRGICVVTGLAGTILMPWLEKKLGLIRAGAWSIVSEALCLAPVLAMLYIPQSPSAGGPAWSAALLFGGMAASRAGLWAFDLCQLKELQLSLQTHPKRNRLMGLQYSMQSSADLVKYVLTIILSRPSQFRWAALVSFVSVCFGVCSYAVFIKRERGHILHLDRIPLLRKAA